MADSPILAGEPFSPEKNQQIAEQFFRDGYVHVPGVLTPGEVSALRDKADEYIDDPEIQARSNPGSPDSRHRRGRYIQLMTNEVSGHDVPFIPRNGIELDQIFVDLLVREPIFSLVEAVVGEDSKFCAQNLLRNLPGLSIDNFHCDKEVYFPLPDEIERHDPRVRMPVMWFTVQMALTDIESIEHGPTQYVPSSHYSGRMPNDQENPEFDGKRACLGILQGGRHLPARPDVLASRCTEHLGPHPLSYSVAVRGTLGVRNRPRP